MENKTYKKNKNKNNKLRKTFIKGAYLIFPDGINLMFKLFPFTPLHKELRYGYLNLLKFFEELPTTLSLFFFVSLN